MLFQFVVLIQLIKIFPFISFSSVFLVSFFFKLLSAISTFKGLLMTHSNPGVHEESDMLHISQERFQDRMEEKWGRVMMKNWKQQ